MLLHRSVNGATRLEEATGGDGHEGGGHGGEGDGEGGGAVAVVVLAHAVSVLVAVEASAGDALVLGLGNGAIGENRSFVALLLNNQRAVDVCERRRKLSHELLGDSRLFNSVFY